MTRLISSVLIIHHHHHHHHQRRTTKWTRSSMTSAGHRNTTSSTRSVRPSGSVRRAPRRIVLVSRLRAERRRAVRRNYRNGCRACRHVGRAPSPVPQFHTQRCSCAVSGRFSRRVLCGGERRRFVSQRHDRCHVVTDATWHETTAADIWRTVDPRATSHLTGRCLREISLVIHYVAGGLRFLTHRKWPALLEPG